MMYKYQRLRVNNLPCLYTNKNSDQKGAQQKLAAKAELKAEQDKKLKARVLGSSYFHGKKHFKNDSTQNYSVFQTV